MIKINTLHLITFQTPQFPRPIKKIGRPVRSPRLPPSAVDEDDFQFFCFSLYSMSSAAKKISARIIPSSEPDSKNGPTSR